MAELNVKIVSVGFSLNDVTPRRMRKVLVDEYAELRNEFYMEWNQMVEGLNSAWNKTFEEGYEQTELDGCYYHQMLSNYMNEVAFSVAMRHPDSYLTPGIYFGAGGQPKFLCRVKQHPGLSMHDGEAK